MTSSDTKLALDGGHPVAVRPVRAVWPRLTDSLIEQVLAQARQAISIYDRSGIVAEFEEAFGNYVGLPRVIATSSGTAALHSIYYGAGIGPGDEVICADYGFFATVTPLVLLGARPVFVDCTLDGTMSATRAEAAVTSRTKAIVVTHMWGQPADLGALTALCARKGLLLFEDCSHAHGARLGGAVVGSFGHAAAWSMQAQKAIWAGEGGVLGTRDPALYERALLLGHFNLRALQEIPQSSPNFALAFTGTGLKYRAHPLALAMALPQIQALDQLLAGRQKSASILMEALLTIPGVRLIVRLGDGIVHGFYGLMALIDPRACGFDRETFVRALQAENIYLAWAPGQMGSMSGYPLFSAAAGREVSADDEALRNSRYITSTAVRFFVPSAAADLTDDTDVSVVAAAIVKVGNALSRAGERPAG